MSSSPYLRGSYHNFSWSTERIDIGLQCLQLLGPRQGGRRHRRPDVRLHLEHRRLANPVTAKPPTEVFPQEMAIVNYRNVRTRPQIPIKW